ncbi:MAG: hypothetical protein ACOYWZ_06635, partial [Bacillota bacterium]
TMLAHAGIAYYKTSKVMNEMMPIGFWFVHLPLMHMSLELMLKSVALYENNSFDLKKYKHNTPKIISDYQNQIDLFNHFAETKQIMDLVSGLKDAWYALRYGETTVRYSEEDCDLFEQIIKQLSTKFQSISGVELK